MQIELIQRKEELPRIEAEWDRLLKENEINEVFLTYKWAYAWLKVFCEDENLFFLTVRDSGQLVGVAPLMIYRGQHLGIRVNFLSFIGKYDSDYNDFIVSKKNKKEILYEIWDYINLNKNQFNLVDFAHIPKTSSTLEIFQQYQKERNIRSKVLFEAICPTHIVDKESEKMFKKKRIRIAERLLSENGKVTIAHLSDIEEIKKFLPDFFEQHIKRRSVTDAESPFLQQKYKLFYEILIEAFSQHNLLSILKLDSRPISYYYGFVYNKKLMLNKPSFDIKYSKYSPGSILLKGIYDYACKNNLGEIDFGRGDDEYKKRFTNKIKENMRIKIYNNFLLYWLDSTKSLKLKY